MAHPAENPCNSKASRKASIVALFLLASGQALAGDIGQSPAESSPRRIIVSIPDRKLVLLEDGEVRKIYDVAVGARVSPSPVGQFKINNRIVKPNYYGTGKVVLPGKNNPLGTRWLGLNKPSYGIHGTSAPKSIGKAASHGCIRMSNRDVEELFELVRPGDAVEILLKPEESVAQSFASEQSEPIRSTSVAPQIAMAALTGEF